LNIAAQVDKNGGTLHIIDPQAKLYLFTLLGKNRKILNTVTSFIDGNPQKKSLEPLTNKEAQQRIDQIFNRVRV